MASRKAGEKLSGYRQSFEDHEAKVKAERRTRKAAAKKSMADGAWKKDISKYNIQDGWSAKLDGTDLKRLRKAGYSDKEIGAWAQGLGENKMTEGILRGNKTIAGKGYIADMKKGSKITDYKAGATFGMADVRSLQRSGFSDSEIAKYAHSQVHNAGTSHGNPMSKFMDKQGKLDYYHGDWNKKKGGTGVGDGGSGSDGSDGVKSPGDKANDLLSRYKYEVGNFTHKPRDYNKVASSNFAGRLEGVLMLVICLSWKLCRRVWIATRSIGSPAVMCRPATTSVTSGTSIFPITRCLNHSSKWKLLILKAFPTNISVRLIALNQSFDLR